MLFYKVSATLDEGRKNGEENNSSIDKEDLTAQIAEAAEEFNRANGPGLFCFVSRIRRNTLTGGIISEDPVDADRTFGRLFAAAKVKVKNKKCSETVFNNILGQLSAADGFGYIDDDEKVLERFGLDPLSGRYIRAISYTEYIVDGNLSREKLGREADGLFSNETLRPELDRIFAGSKNAKAYGHPVHYMVESGSASAAGEIAETLIKALYTNGRLKSRRYCSVDLRPGQDLSKRALDALYKSCTGGAVTISYAPYDGNSDDVCTSGELDVISFLCDMTQKYRNRVLTIFCLPLSCERTKKTFYECLGTVSTVEIKEDLADCGKSKEYLGILCRRNHVRADGKLYSRLDPDEKHYPDELRVIFDEWFNDKLRNSVFPQYRDTAVARAKAMKTAPRGTAYDDLCGMVGLTEAKAVIRKALDFYKVRRILNDDATSRERPAMHMIFTGNPGTAKTTVARLFARIMKENGLLSRGHLVEVGRGDLVGKYIGWTAQIVKEKFKAAMGGVLFIDEAYSLVDDRSGSFGDEAINTIVQEMENRREDLVVIFAGYPKEMEGFLNKNPGIRSRIAFHVPFSDYNSDELCDIARLIGKSKGLTLTDGAVEKLRGVFEVARRSPDFGNGRYVRNVIELSQLNQASRIVKTYSDSFRKSDLETIVEEDIELPAIKKERTMRPIGFTA